MGNFLSSPLTKKESECHEFASGLVVGASAMQGWRRDMEDQHIVKTMPSLGDHLLLAVFDGHGGKGAAIYAEAQLISVIENTEEWKKYLESTDRSPAILGAALSASFLQIDKMMRTFQDTTNGQDCSGCTSVVCMVTPTHFVCSNAGDSRCVLGTNAGTIPMSEDHKPTDEGENNRILNAGGTVQMGRVDGDLAVSRAFGDFQFKMRSDLDDKQQRVTALPDIKIVERTSLDDILILACDGLWDVYSSEEGINQIRELFAEGESDVSLVAEEMLDLSLFKGSRDNISAVIVRLPGASVGPMEGGGVMARRVVRKAEEEKEKNEQDAADVGGPEIEAEEVNSEDSNDAAGGSSGL